MCVDADPDSPSDLMEKHVRVSPSHLLIMKNATSDGWKREDQLCSISCSTIRSAWCWAISVSSVYMLHQFLNQLVFLILTVTENSASWIKRMRVYQMNTNEFVPIC